MFLRACCFIFSLAASFGLLAQIPSTVRPAKVGNQRVINYDINEGMSSRNVNVVAQAVDDLVWCGTADGLDVFDGVEFHSYYTESDPGLKSNFITALLPVDSGMWIGTDLGLSFYNLFKDTIIGYEFKGLSQEQEAFIVRDVYVREDGLLWLAMKKTKIARGGLWLFDPVTSEVTETPGLDKGSVWCIRKDPVEPKKWWFGGNHLGYFRDGDEAVTLFVDSTLWRRDNVQDIAFHDGHVWCATWSAGIVEFDPKSETYVEEHRYAKGWYSGVRSMTRKDDNTFWVTSPETGFGLFDVRDRTFTFYPNDPEDEFSLPYISGRDVFVGKDNQVFIGMASGFSILSPYAHQVRYVKSSVAYTREESRFYSVNQAVLQGDEIFAMVGNKKGSVILDATTKEVKREIPGLWGVVTRKHNGKVYAMTGNYVWEVSMDTNSWEKVLDLGDYGLSGASARVNTIWSGQDGLLHLGSDDNTIHRFNTETGECSITWLEGDGPTSGIPNVVFEIGETQDSTIWACSELGVYSFRDGKVERLSDIAKNPEVLEGMTILALTCTGDEVVMGSLGRGLLVYDMSTGQITQYNRSDGLRSMRIAEMEVDRNGDVWFITSNGLHQYSHEKKRIRAFGPKDGIKKYDLINHEVSVLDNGEVLIGYSRGVGYFHPDELLEVPLPDHIHFSEVFVDGVAFETDSAVNHMGKITLPKDSRRVWFNFQGVSLVQAELLSYEYQLKGVSDEWKKTNGSQVLFSDLGPGDYDLNVRAIGPSGDRMSVPTSIRFEVTRSWYKSAWFTAAIILLSIGLIVLGFALRLRNIRSQSAMKNEYNKRLAEVEMTALRAQMNPHFLFNCLNSIKFFIIQNDTDKASDYLTKFGRLIRLILQNSKSELITLDLELEALSLYVELESLRFENKFHYELKIMEDVSVEYFEVPPLIIQPFVENAIWHGLMHKKQGDGELKVTISMHGDAVRCEIEDNGVGRDRAAELKSKSATRKKSMGIDITRNRLMNLNEDLELENAIKVVDLKDDEGRPSGTRVIIDIPG